MKVLKLFHPHFMFHFVASFSTISMVLLGCGENNPSPTSIEIKGSSEKFQPIQGASKPTFAPLKTASPKVQTFYQNRQFYEAISMAKIEKDAESTQQILSYLEFILQTESYQEIPQPTQLALPISPMLHRKYIQFKSGLEAVFISTQGPDADFNYQYWQSELGAYLLSEKLGLHFIPFTTKFFYQDGNLGVLQILPHSSHMASTLGGATQSDSYLKMKIFDFLIGNVNRIDATGTQKNWYYWPSEDRVVPFDHAIAFQDREAGCFATDSNGNMIPVLYTGFKDKKRRGQLRNGRSFTSRSRSYDCDQTRMRVNPSKGVTDRISIREFKKLDPQFLANIQSLKDAEVKEILETLIPLLPLAAPSPTPTPTSTPTNKNLDSIIRRLHDLQNALTGMGL